MTESQSYFVFVGILATVIFLFAASIPFQLGREDIIEDCQNYGEVVYEDVRYVCYPAADGDSQ